MKKFTTILICFFSAFLMTLHAQIPDRLMYTTGNTIEDDGTYLWEYVYGPGWLKEVQKRCHLKIIV